MPHLREVLPRRAAVELAVAPLPVERVDLPQELDEVEPLVLGLARFGEAFLPNKLRANGWHFADFDGDGVLEVCSGNRIYDGVTGADKTPSVMSVLGAGGYGAVGDFNKDTFGKSPMLLIKCSADIGSKGD